MDVATTPRSSTSTSGVHHEDIFHPDVGQGDLFTSMLHHLGEGTPLTYEIISELESRFASKHVRVCAFGLKGKEQVSELIDNMAQLGVVPIEISLEEEEGCVLEVVDSDVLKILSRDIYVQGAKVNFSPCLPKWVDRVPLLPASVLDALEGEDLDMMEARLASSSLDDVSDEFCQRLRNRLLSIAPTVSHQHHQQKRPHHRHVGDADDDDGNEGDTGGDLAKARLLSLLQGMEHDMERNQTLDGPQYNPMTYADVFGSPSEGSEEEHIARMRSELLAAEEYFFSSEDSAKTHAVAANTSDVGEVLVIERDGRSPSSSSTTTMETNPPLSTIRHGGEEPSSAMARSLGKIGPRTIRRPPGLVVEDELPSSSSSTLPHDGGGGTATSGEHNADDVIFIKKPTHQYNTPGVVHETMKSTGPVDSPGNIILGACTSTLEVWNGHHHDDDDDDDDDPIVAQSSQTALVGKAKKKRRRRKKKKKKKMVDETERFGVEHGGELEKGLFHDEVRGNKEQMDDAQTEGAEGEIAEEVEEDGNGDEEEEEDSEEHGPDVIDVDEDGVHVESMMGVSLVEQYFSVVLEVNHLDGTPDMYLTLDNMLPHDTIYDLLRKVIVERGIVPASSIELLHQGHSLNDAERTLEDYGIGMGASVVLNPKGEGLRYRILLEDYMHEKRLVVHVGERDTVEDIQQRVEDKEGTPKQDVYFWLNETLLLPSDTLRQFDECYPYCKVTMFLDTEGTLETLVNAKMEKLTKWKCPSCRMINKNHLKDKCVMCGYVRPAEKNLAPYFDQLKREAGENENPMETLRGMAMSAALMNIYYTSVKFSKRAMENSEDANEHAHSPPPCRRVGSVPIGVYHPNLTFNPDVGLLHSSDLAKSPPEEDAVPSQECHFPNTPPQPHHSSSLSPTDAQPHDASLSASHPTTHHRHNGVNQSHGGGGGNATSTSNRGSSKARKRRNRRRKEKKKLQREREEQQRIFESQKAKEDEYDSVDVDAMKEENGPLGQHFHHDEDVGGDGMDVGNGGACSSHEEFQAYAAGAIEDDSLDHQSIVAEEYAKGSGADLEDVPSSKERAVIATANAENKGRRKGEREAVEALRRESVELLRRIRMQEREMASLKGKLLVAEEQIDRRTTLREREKEKEIRKEKEREKEREREREWRKETEKQIKDLKSAVEKERALIDGERELWNAEKAEWSDRDEKNKKKLDVLTSRLDSTNERLEAQMKGIRDKDARIAQLKKQVRTLTMKAAAHATHRSEPSFRDVDDGRVDSSHDEERRTISQSRWAALSRELEERKIAHISSITNLREENDRMARELMALREEHQCAMGSVEAMRSMPLTELCSLRDVLSQSVAMINGEIDARYREKLSSTTEGTMCQVCFANEANVLLLPCSHLSVCHFCVRPHRRPLDVCPVCGVPVRQHHRVMSTTGR